MTKKFSGLTIASLAVAFALFGCDSNGGGATAANGADSSSSSTKNNPSSKDDDEEDKTTETIEAETLDDLPKCTSKKEGTLASVEDDGLEYYCYDTEWIGTAATKAKLPDCTAKKEGDRIYVKKSEEVFYCSEDGEWVTTNDVDDPDGDTKSSSSSKPKEKVVEFVDGVIWQPSYGRRAYTGETGIDEYNFLDEDAEGEAGAGWWYKFLDNGQGGSSTAVGK